jgi:hypothetical protein
MLLDEAAVRRLLRMEEVIVATGEALAAMGEALSPPVLPACQV